MIYPSLYRYNAPYRGPRDSKELSKTLTSIKYDIDTLTAEAKRQENDISNNIKHAIGEIDTALTDKMTTAVEINEDDQKYEGLNYVQIKLRLIDRELDAFMRNL